jgi:hypothetical protein
MERGAWERRGRWKRSCRGKEGRERLEVTAAADEEGRGRERACTRQERAGHARVVAHVASRRVP